MPDNDLGTGGVITRTTTDTTITETDIREFMSTIQSNVNPVVYNWSSLDLSPSFYNNEEDEMLIQEEMNRQATEEEDEEEIEREDREDRVYDETIAIRRITNAGLYDQYLKFNITLQRYIRDTFLSYTFMKLDHMTNITGYSISRTHGLFNILGMNMPSLEKDCLIPIFHIIDEEYEITKVYSEINEGGALINCLGKTTFGDVFRLPKVFDPSCGKYVHITRELFNSELFHKHYKEDFAVGKFYHNEVFEKFALKIPKNKISFIETSVEIGRFKEFMKNKPNTYINTQGKKYTYGLELETASGRLPNYLKEDIFYGCEYDGSLRDRESGECYGGEYITDILQGDMGLLQIKRLCYELTNRCTVDHKCGVHVHIGGMTLSKENVILLYEVCREIQSSIFGLLPPSRRNNEYCRPLVDLGFRIDSMNKDREYNIERYYTSIIEYISKSSPSKTVNKKRNHPRGSKCGYDHSSGRYCWLNLVPALFNTRGNNSYTVEFRPMSGTTSYYKVKNWLLICFAIVDFVENHKQEIYAGNITLENIIKKCYPKDHVTILDFIKERKDKFSNKFSSIEEAKDYLDNSVDNNFSVKSL
jgi:hypothetical protein